MKIRLTVVRQSLRLGLGLIQALVLPSLTAAPAAQLSTPVESGIPKPRLSDTLTGEEERIIVTRFGLNPLFDDNEEEFFEERSVSHPNFTALALRSYFQDLSEDNHKLYKSFIEYYSASSTPLSSYEQILLSSKAALEAAPFDEREDVRTKNRVNVSHPSDQTYRGDSDAGSLNANPEAPLSAASTTQAGSSRGITDEDMLTIVSRFAIHPVYDSDHQTFFSEYRLRTFTSCMEDDDLRGYFNLLYANNRWIFKILLRDYALKKIKFLAYTEKLLLTQLTAEKLIREDFYSLPIDELEFLVYRFGRDPLVTMRHCAFIQSLLPDLNTASIFNYFNILSKDSRSAYRILRDYFLRQKNKSSGHRGWDSNDELEASEIPAEFRPLLGKRRRDAQDAAGPAMKKSEAEALPGSEKQMQGPDLMPPMAMVAHQEREPSNLSAHLMNSKSLFRERRLKYQPKRLAERRRRREGDKVNLNRDQAVSIPVTGIPTRSAAQKPLALRFSAQGDPDSLGPASQASQGEPLLTADNELPHPDLTVGGPATVVIHTRTEWQLILKVLQPIRKKALRQLTYDGLSAYLLAYVHSAPRNELKPIVDLLHQFQMNPTWFGRAAKAFDLDSYALPSNYVQAYYSLEAPEYSRSAAIVRPMDEM